MTTYNQDYRNETGEKAERSSTIVEFYDRCRKSADKSTPWHMLPLQYQIAFTQAVDTIHKVIYNHS